MAKYDGHIKIGTAIDTEGAKEDFKELEKAIEKHGAGSEEKLNHELKKMEADYEKTARAIEKQVEKINDANAKLNKLDSIDDLKGKIGEVRADMKSNRSDIEVKKQSHLAGDMSVPDYTEAYNKANKEYEEMGAKLSELKKKMAELQQETKNLDASKLTDSIRDAEVETNRLGLKLDEIQGKTRDKTAELGKSAQKLQEGANNAHKLGDELKKSSNASSDLGKSVSSGVGKLAKYALALFSVRTAYSAISSLSRKVINGNDEMGQRLKAQIESITNVATNLLAPVISWIVTLISTAVGYLAAAIKLLFGIDILSKKTNKNVGGVGKGVSNANKEMKKFLAGFDEVEKLSAETADNMSSAEVGGMDEIAIPNPDTSIFENIIDKLKNSLINIWNTEDVQKFFDSISRIGNNTFNSITSIGSNVWNNMMQSWQAMLPHLESGISNALGFYNDVLEDIANSSDVWFPIITESINGFVDDIFETFRPLTTFLVQMWSDMWGIVRDLWNEYGASILNGFLEWFNNVTQIFNKIWTDIIDPILSPAIEWMKKIWDEHLKGVVSDFFAFVLELQKGTLEIYNKVIAPIVNWIIDKLSPIFKWFGENIIPLIGSYISVVIDQIGNIIRTAKGMLQGLIDFIVGVFTRDWERVWSGIGQFFGSVFNGMKEMFKTPINWIIDRLNEFLRSLNKVKIPDWVPLVGGKGFSFGQIPRLQRGGIVNRPMQAMIADGGREAVIPLENDTRALQEIAQLLNGFMGGGGETIQNNLYVDGVKLLEIITQVKRRLEMQGNGDLAYDF